jgi:predicted O-methyltransferase YrrM
MKREDFNFNNYYKLGRGVEVGTQRGLFAREIKYDGEIICVDIWEDEDIFQEALNNLPNCTLYRIDSLSASKLFEDESLDWVYIDADHTYDGVKADLNAWIPKVRKGGLVMGHDYFNGEYKGINFGVKKAVDELKKELKFLDDFDLNNRNFLSFYYVK